MGHRCCSKQKVKRGLWSPEEDDKLIKHITAHGHGSWSSVPKLAGLQRCGKSCRLRWINYLRPDLKKGSFTAEEEQIIIDVHRILGNRWAQIAKHLPGRTDNEVKNFWNSCIKKKLLSQGLDPKTHNLLSTRQRSSNKFASSQPQQQSFKVVNISSTSTSTSQVITDHATMMVMMNPHPHDDDDHVPKFPAPPPAPVRIHDSEVRQSTIDINGTCIYGQNNNLHESTVFPYGSSMENTCTIPGFNNLLEDQISPCNIWDANAMFETFEEAIVEGVVKPQQQQQKQQQQQQQEMEMEKIDSSFESCNFDFGLLESTLMSAEMCSSDRDLSSMDDFVWNF